MSNTVEVEISAILKNLNGNITFLQPALEAIVNSLEANATKIEVEFFKSAQTAMDDKMIKIDEYTITDNGDGFNEDNINSFKKLWSEHKLDLGCKGSGRFTWLKVFKNISIVSELKNTNTQVVIPFSVNFGNQDIEESLAKSKIDHNITKVTFTNLTEDYFKSATDKKYKRDRRENADLEAIYDKINNSLLVKLFLLKQQGAKFDICLILDGQEKHITNESIPSLEFQAFTMKADYVNQPDIPFVLYYIFNENNKNSKKVHLCAAGRIVSTLNDDDLGFSANLPNKDSFEMLLCSEYLDKNVSDDRTTLSGLEGLKQATLDKPLIMTTIISCLKNKVNEIIIEKYPDLVDKNTTIIENAVNMAPYLTKYIRENSDVLVSEKSLVTAAQKEFNSRKVKIQSKFKGLLSDVNVDPNELNNTLSDISEMALSELGEYILYRDAIIRALQNAIIDTTKNEDFIHDIFMPRRTKTDTQNANNGYATNLWLFDDKFMTFTNAFSDVNFKQIVETIFDNTAMPTDDLGMDLKKPDLAIFYNRDISRDALIVEFKGANAPLGEKEKAIGEIGRNCLLLKEKVPDINTIWAYIVTNIDHEFEVSLKGNGYKPRFTNANDGKIMYFYNDSVPVHVYALDLGAITADALARNKTFLDILKKN